MPKRILLVDDEPRSLALMECLLEPLGHALLRASDGAAALALFESDPPDLILLDYKMTGLDGIDVLTHIRASERGADTPVVLITAFAEREHRLAGMEAGADDFLEKPIDREMLLARVRTLLALKCSRDELVTRNTALEQAQREQRELTECVVHDLRSPLTVLLSCLDWMGERFPGPDAEVAAALSDAKEAVRRLTTMTSDLLEVSRLDRPWLVLRRESVDVAALLSAVTRSFLRLAEEVGVSLTAESVPMGLRADLDPTLLKRVLENLLDNAFRYTPKGGRIEVAARASVDTELTVSNDGSAIPPADRLKIFDKYAQGPDGAHGEAGLGLFFCKRAVAAHGGTIDVTDTPEWPTSFVIHLPSGPAA